MKKFAMLITFAVFTLTSNGVIFLDKNPASAETEAINIIVKPRKNNNNTKPITEKKNIIQKTILPVESIKPSNILPASVEKINWYSFDEGMKKAKETNKYVFIDVYTDWCVYCTNLDKETYSNEKVAKYLNEKFIAIKVDAESSKKVTYNGNTFTEKQLASNLLVREYPSMYFMKDEKIIYKVTGFMKAPTFYSYTDYIGSEAFKNQDFDKYQQSNKN